MFCWLNFRVFKGQQINPSACYCSITGGKCFKCFFFVLLFLLCPYPASVVWATLFMGHTLTWCNYLIYHKRVTASKKYNYKSMCVRIYNVDEGINVPRLGSVATFTFKIKVQCKARRKDGRQGKLIRLMKRIIILDDIVWNILM